jgi:hypothetical protein
MPTCSGADVGLVPKILSIVPGSQREAANQAAAAYLAILLVSMRIDENEDVMPQGVGKASCGLPLCYWPTTSPLPGAYFCNPVPSQKMRKTDGRREESLPVKKI